MCCLCVRVLVTTVSPAKRLNRSRCRLGQTRVGPINHVLYLDGATYVRQLANMIELVVVGGDVQYRYHDYCRYKSLFPERKRQIVKIKLS